VTFTKENFSAIWEKKQERWLLGQIPLKNEKDLTIVFSKICDVDREIAILLEMNI
jgi:hypothetical protein